MCWPGRIPANTVCDKIAATINILPTLAAMVDAPLPDMRARHIRVKARNVGICPDWHLGARGKAWLFCDEIIID